MDTTYKGWNLAFHGVQKGILTEEDGPPFNMDIFRHYLQYTYMSCGQVGGIEVPDVANIESLVLAANVQMYEPRPFDYATYVYKNYMKVS